MQRINALNPETTTGKSKELFDAVQAKLGMVPNMMRTMGVSPVTLGTYLSFSEAAGKSTLSNKLSELISLTVANINGCEYCNAAHSFIGEKLVGLDQDTIKAAREGRSEDLKTNAALTFARAIVENKGRVSDYDFSKVENAEMLSITPKALAKLTKTHLNKTLTELINERIIIEAKRELYLTNKPVKEIAYDLGYNDEYYFSRFFKKNAEVSPQEYRDTVGFNRAAMA